MALPAYRHLLRATRIAFANDTALLRASREQARSTFQKNAHLLAAASPEAQAQIQHAEEVAKVLRRNVVQGERIGAEGDDRWRLRIHEETERGDNETIKTAGKGTATVDGGKCLP